MPTISIVYSCFRIYVVDGAWFVFIVDFYRVMLATMNA